MNQAIISSKNRINSNIPQLEVPAKLSIKYKSIKILFISQRIVHSNITLQCFPLQDFRVFLGLTQKAMRKLG